MNNELTNYLSNEHLQNLNKEAYDDICSILMDFHSHQNEFYSTKWVCNAPMGHGKTTAIISYLKWNNKEPILLCVREKQLAHEIYEEVKKVNKSIINLNADNKEVFEEDLLNYQIVIIQHERLKNLALKFGNMFNYQYYKKGRTRTKRKLIIDERPIFHDSATYDITSNNNVLEWFDALSKPFKYKPLTIQKYKSYITYLVSSQLADNYTDITNALVSESDTDHIKTKELISFLIEMEEHPDNTDNYNALNSLKHFKKLLKVDGYGRIDDYTYNKTGRKIIVSKFIDYGNLRMNIIVFDGTATVTNLLYKTDFELKEVLNRNDYSRLTIHNDQLNTSLYSRSKDNNSTQRTISERIKELKNTHESLFVLPMKNEVSIYKSSGAISEDDLHYYKDDNSNQTKGLNLLNTTGKNALNNLYELYIPCLPKRNAEYYKELAIAIYGENVSLLTSKDNDNGNWFQDENLEEVYKQELYAEILQILHRTALRKIDEDKQVDIYLVYDDSRNSSNYDYKPLLLELRDIYKMKEVNIDINKLINSVDYGRDKVLDEYIRLIEEMNILGELPVSKVNNSFKNYIKKHFTEKGDMINFYLGNKGYRVIEKKDRYSTKSRYIVRV